MRTTTTAQSERPSYRRDGYHGDATDDSDPPPIARTLRGRTVATTIRGGQTLRRGCRAVVDGDRLSIRDRIRLARIMAARTHINPRWSSSSNADERPIVSGGPPRRHAEDEHRARHCEEQLRGEIDAQHGGEAASGY
ncbi:hypothetical protein [Catenulispora acidiphila]|uniref:hypothetical protein n=1 Tax=Catenulispora acidiphila TaxID=304895 RepID=UPI0011815662|nr:hypothetical protein [Catenulispora acidiphila]